MFNWLSYSNDPNSQAPGNDRGFFMRREWSFTLEDDIYWRYQSFRDVSEFSQQIQKNNPHKIDIGAVFTIRPEMNIKSEQFKPVERELVFDIDMTDYDDIRTCCTGAEICRRCWPYMTMAIKVVDRALRDDFAFRHILWVYSGRRGVHCWVCDPEARSLSNDARTAVVDYLSVHTGSADNSDKKLKASFTNPHPMMRRAYELLDPYFERCIADEKGQGLLARKDRYMTILNGLPNEFVRKELYDNWEKHTKLTGAQRWQQMREATTASASESQLNNQVKRKRVNYLELEAWRYELVFSHCYPRLDANVSKTQNHLLKSPFCVHPKTGRVCIPIDAANADEFSPFDVPTVRSLCGEVRKLFL
jgi:DNA primase small subunit